MKVVDVLVAPTVALGGTVNTVELLVVTVNWTPPFGAAYGIMRFNVWAVLLIFALVCGNETEATPTPRGPIKTVNVMLGPVRLSGSVT